MRLARMAKVHYDADVSLEPLKNKTKFIIDLIYQKGFVEMLKTVSDTAKYSGLTVGPKIIDVHVKENMRKVVKSVQSGEFAREWTEKSSKAQETLEALMKPIEERQIEKVGKFIRKTARIEK